MESDQVLGGRYALVDQVGTGGSAVVWRAKDQVLGRTVAVKLLAGPHAGDPESRRRIREEARAAATLSHPNIAQVHDYGESDEGGVCTPYVVMELVRGSTLQQRMAAGPLPPRFAMRVAAEVAAALAAAHADGLVHRDIKPANVMITPDGAKVVDFGIAAAIDPSLAGPPEDEVLGTPAYLAPERLTDGAVEPASDVYALGVLLYRLLSGQAPWSADTTTQMLTAHIYIEPTPLWRLPDVPGYITALCNRCLSKDPTERPSARDAAALLAQGAGLTVVEDDPPSVAAVPMAEPSVLIRRDAAIATDGPVAVAAPAAVTTSPHRRRIPLLAAAVLLVAVAAVLWLVVPGRGEPSPEAAVPGASAPGVPATVPSASGAPPGRPADVPAPPPGRSPGTTTVPGATPAGPGAPPPRATTPVTAPATTGPGTVPTTDEPAPTTGAPPLERTLSSAGGTVRATCPDATTAQLLWWSATKPYRVGRVEAGPASAAVAVFIRGKQQVRMTVTCTAGIPSTANEEV